MAKAAANMHFSFLVFGFTQVVIDTEPLYYMVQGLWPIHRFFHTYLGATLIAIFAVTIGRPLLALVIRLWNRLLVPSLRTRLSMEPWIPFTAAVSGALFGGYSHVLLDSVMHSDVRPFAPWSDSNGMLHLMSVGHLYLFCAGFGVLGGVMLLLGFVRRKIAS